MKKILALSLLFLLFQFLPTGRSFGGGADALAAGDWKQTFNELCAKTQNAMAYTPDELRDFVAGCDRLKTVIDELQEPEKTVYGKRLERCRGVFDFVLQAKEKEKE